MSRPIRIGVQLAPQHAGYPELRDAVRRMEDLGVDLRPLTLGLRTGDTPTAERQKMLRKPPEILITTPESLHLLLTSRARETLRRIEFAGGLLNGYRLMEEDQLAA